MDTQFIVMLCALPVFYAGLYAYMKKKKKAQTELIANTNLEQSMLQADTFRDNFIAKKLNFLRKEMAGKPIDALVYASLPYTTADSLKDGMKDSLKSLATLGFVRYNTVQTPIYLVLSGEEVHMIQLSPSDDVENHYVFNAMHLQQSTIKKAELTATDKGHIKREGDDLKVYEITFKVNHDDITLKLYTALLFSFAHDYAGTMFKNAQSFVEERAIALQFFDKLGKRYANLNVNHLL